MACGVMLIGLACWSELCCDQMLKIREVPGYTLVPFWAGLSKWPGLHSCSVADLCQVWTSLCSISGARLQMPGAPCITSSKSLGVRKQEFGLVSTNVSYALRLNGLGGGSWVGLGKGCAQLWLQDLECPKVPSKTLSAWMVLRSQFLVWSA